MNTKNLDFNGLDNEEILNSVKEVLKERLTLKDKLNIFKKLVKKTNTENTFFNLPENFLLNTLNDLNELIHYRKEKDIKLNTNYSFELDYIINLLNKNSFDFSLVPLDRYYYDPKSDSVIIEDIEFLYNGLINPLIEANYLKVFYFKKDSVIEVDIKGDFYYILFNKPLSEKESRDLDYYFSYSLFSFLIALYGNESETFELGIRTF